MPIARSLSTAVALASATFLAAACADGRDSTPLAPDADAHVAHAARAAHSMGANTGTTGGWADGKRVTFFYNRPFFCETPSTSTAGASACALNVEPEARPRGGPIPVVYVMVPLGFRPDEATLQCPVVGECINHPSTMDLSRVFGAGTENAALPAHSHVIGAEDSNIPSAGWWEIEVVGVTDPAVWGRLVAGKSLATVRELQRAGEGITGDIPTNLFLFFGVRR